MSQCESYRISPWSRLGQGVCVRGATLPVQIWTVGQVNGVASSYDVAEGCNTQDADMLKYALVSAPFRVPVVCNGEHEPLHESVGRLGQAAGQWPTSYA